MKQVIELEGLTIIGEAKDLDKLRKVITRGCNQFFEKAENATEEEAGLVEYWTGMGQYAYWLSAGIINQIRKESEK